MEKNSFWKLIYKISFILLIHSVLNKQAIGNTPNFPVKTYEKSNLSSGISNSDRIVNKSSYLGEIVAPSGNLADIQLIANQLSTTGGTIIIPEGHFDWNGGTLRMPDGISLIGDGQEKTFLHQTNFEINRTEINDGIVAPFRISGISFIFYPEGTVTIDRGVGTMVLHNVVDFRIDHCDFIGSTRAIRFTDWENYPNSRGVIDHCKFLSGVSEYNTPYGISVGPTPYGSDNRINNIGTENAIFAEDCYFEFPTGTSNHPIAAFNGGHYVLRHSIIRNSGHCDGHGNGYELFPLVTNNYRGTKCYEIYNNSFVFVKARNRTRGYAPFIPRSGGGIFYNNTVENYENLVIFRIDLRDPAQAGWDGSSYPAPDQIHDFYIWDNIATNIGSMIKIETDPLQLIKENRDYFLRAPSKEIDGFTYTPYIYPHPLVSGITSILNPENFKSNNALKLFPNPVNDILNIEASLEILEVEIISLTGTILKKYIIAGSQTLKKCSINVSNLNAGTYIAKIKTANCISQELFVKAKLN